LFQSVKNYNLDFYCIKNTIQEMYNHNNNYHIKIQHKVGYNLLDNSLQINNLYNV